MVRYRCALAQRNRPGGRRSKPLPFQRRGRFPSGIACGGGWRVRFRPPRGGRCRPEAGAPNSRRGSRPGGRYPKPLPFQRRGRFPSGIACGGGWRVRFRPPRGGRCRPEAGAPNSRRGSRPGGRYPKPLPFQRRGRFPSGIACGGGWRVRFRPPRGSRCRPEAGAPNSRSGSRPGGRYSKPLPFQRRGRFPSGIACGGGWRVRFRPPLGGRCRPEAGVKRHELLRTWETRTFAHSGL